MKDFYAILEIDDTASAEDIKKAYRKLAKKYHPDTNPGDEAASKMQEVNEAYETLSNSERKASYDFSRKDPFDVFRNVHTNMYSYDIPMHITILIDVTLEDIYENKNITKEYKRYVPCDTCNGGMSKCENKDCRNGLVEATESFNLETGRIRESCQYDIAGMGNFTPGSIWCGALRVYIQVQPHNYQIRGSDLHLDLNIHYQDAIDGLIYDYKHLDGKSYSLRIPPGSNAGQLLRMSGKGLRGAFSARGNLFFHIVIFVDYDRIKQYNIDEQQTEQL